MATVNPTRMNLINTKRSIGVASKGHDILKRKREVLVMEFLKLLGSSKNDRTLLQQILQQAYKTVMMGSTYIGNFELEEMALHTEEASPIRISIKNVMGVNIPEISKGEVKAAEFHYSSSLAVDDITDSFSRVRDMVIDVAQREQGLKRLVLEIDKTKRRVNALEYIVIPNMKGTAKYITMRLEEMDRDMFSALKHVKKKLAT